MPSRPTCCRSSANVDQFADGNILGLVEKCPHHDTMPLMNRKTEDQHSERETVERADAALKRMLATPPKRHGDMKIGKKRGARRSEPPPALKKKGQNRGDCP
jgi:hypothetical protein